VTFGDITIGTVEVIIMLAALPWTLFFCFFITAGGLLE
tara:strand:+ start:443 stop:556 length:114 start_codon:yes stop_codon:yes gene_type:complete